MNSYQDFTWDPVNYPQSEVASFTEELHKSGQRYVVILDPGIRNITGYTPYDEGLKQDIFIKEGDGQTPFIGRVWPGYTAFPDFLNPNTQSYWTEQISTFLSGVPYDGLWSAHTYTHTQHTHTRTVTCLIVALVACMLTHLVVRSLSSLSHCLSLSHIPGSI